MPPKFRCVKSFIIPGKKKKAHTTLYVTELTESGGSGRLEEHLTSAEDEEPPPGRTVPRASRLQVPLLIPPHLKSPTSRSIKSRGDKFLPEGAKKVTTWMNETGLKGVVRKREVKDFLSVRAVISAG